MVARMAKIDLQAVDAVKNQRLGEGQKFIAVAAHSYGYGKTATEAIKNAKSLRIPSYESSKIGWAFVLFIAEQNVEIDGMGGFVYMPREDGKPAYREIYRTPNLASR